MAKLRDGMLLGGNIFEYHCAACGWPVITCISGFEGPVVNDKTKEAAEHDTFCYCSNIKCQHHTGEGTDDLQHAADWMV